MNIFIKKLIEIEKMCFTKHKNSKFLCFVKHILYLCKKFQRYETIIFGVLSQIRGDGYAF